MSPMMFPFLTGMVPPLVKEKLGSVRVTQGPESLRPELVSDHPLRWMLQAVSDP